jgi:hypothetical protein
MGMFDDLIPKGGQGGGISVEFPRMGSGSISFDDLVPPAWKQIDMTRAPAAVRADIEKLSGKDRDAALKEWAKTYVAKERKDGGVLQTVDDTVRAAARGTFVGPWLDEITATTGDVANKVTGGFVGAPYDETLAYQRERDRAFDAENPVASTAVQLAGGLAGGGAALKTGGTILDKGVKLAAGGPLAAWQPGKSLPKKTVQGTVTGGLYGANAGAGNAEDGQRLEGAETGAKIGATLGTVAPAVIQGAGSAISRVGDAISPVTARIGANLHDLKGRLAIRASGGQDAGPLVSPGADAAADQIIANQLSRANVTPAMLRQRFADADEAARFSSSGTAQNVTAPVDIDPSLQRLAGSVARQQPEAGNVGASFQYARQTGQPSGLPLPREANLPARPAMSQPVPGAPPMGQFERVRDALQRALQIKDHKGHGHGRSAYETENLIINRARDEARVLYREAYDQAQNVNLRPVIEPVMEKWRNIAAEEPEAVGRAIRQLLRQFETRTGPVTNLERFDKAKQFADGIIKKWFEGLEGRNKYVGGVLAQMQREMLEAVDGVGAMGPAYQKARDTFSNEMTLRDALKLGRSVFREDSEVVVDQFRNLATEGERKLFRLGILDGFSQQMGRKARSDDVTKVFTSPRVQEILREVIPTSKAADATFANRPERFGNFIGNERRMIETRNKTLGGSPTAERLADDEALNGMQSMIDAAKNSVGNGGTTNFAMRMAENVLNRLFGFRADTAAAVAQKLYTASPAEQAKLLSELERRMGPSRYAQFQRLMAESQQAFGAPAGTVAGGGQQGGP